MAAAGLDGPTLRELAGLSGSDSHGVRDLLGSALAEAGAGLPLQDQARALDGFNGQAALHLVYADLAEQCLDRRVRARWTVSQVTAIMAANAYDDAFSVQPLGELLGLDDEWGAGWGTRRLRTTQSSSSR